MHFCTQDFNDHNEIESNWYCMTFRQDLLDLIEQYGRLPYTEMEESLQAVQQKENEINAVTDKNTKLQT